MPAVPPNVPAPAWARRKGPSDGRRPAADIAILHPGLGGDEPWGGCGTP